MPNAPATASVFGAGARLPLESTTITSPYWFVMVPSSVTSSSPCPFASAHSTLALPNPASLIDSLAAGAASSAATSLGAGARLPSESSTITSPFWFVMVPSSATSRSPCPFASAHSTLALPNPSSLIDSLAAVGALAWSIASPKADGAGARLPSESTTITSPFWFVMVPSSATSRSPCPCRSAHSTLPLPKSSSSTQSS